MYQKAATVDFTTHTPIRYVPHRFMVDEYYRMAEVGILDEHDRVELIDGQILVMEPIGPEHAGNTNRLNRLFHSVLGERAIVGIQNPIQIDRFNHPQPDVVVCKPRDDFYEQCHPTPEDIYLVVEIAWTSAARDRTLKAPLYGRAGIPEFWLIDISGRTIDVYTDPSEDGYDRVERLRPGASLRPSAFSHVELQVDDVIGSG